MARGFALDGLRGRDGMPATLRRPPGRVESNRACDGPATVRSSAGDRAVTGRLLPLLLPNWVERAATGWYGAARNRRQNRTNYDWPTRGGMAITE
jgi:hypothetical protein